MNTMDKQEVLELYGQSVYHIRLQVATQLFCKDHQSPEHALELADEFVAALLAEDEEEIC